MRQTNFAVLAIGGLTSMTRLCLESICKLGKVKIFILTEAQNIKIFESFFVERKVPYAIFQPKVEMFSDLPAQKSRDDYEEYGSTRFALINTLKWDLINRSFGEINSGEIIVFSDFDIIWYKVPELENGEMKFVDIVAQREWQKIESAKFCTGIMAFRKNEATRAFIKELNVFHADRIDTANEEYFDQQAFNDFVLQEGLISKVGQLSSEQYVIGAEVALNLMKNYEKIFAIHVNYLKGSAKKVRLMEALVKEQKKALPRIFVAVIAKALFIDGRIRMHVLKRF
jgi:hypothetical protein